MSGRPGRGRARGRARGQAQGQEAPARQPGANQQQRANGNGYQDGPRVSTVLCTSLLYVSNQSHKVAISTWIYFM